MVCLPSSLPARIFDTAFLFPGSCSSACAYAIASRWRSCFSNTSPIITLADAWANISTKVQKYVVDSGAGRLSMYDRSQLFGEAKAIVEKMSDSALSLCI